MFDATLLARSVRDGALRLDDFIAKYVSELRGDIRRVTLGQLATHTSGLLLPQDHPPWPDWGYTLPEFIRTLNAWKAERSPVRSISIRTQALSCCSSRWSADTANQLTL